MQTWRGQEYAVGPRRTVRLCSIGVFSIFSYLMVKVVDDSAMSWKEHINYCKAYQSQGSTKQYVFIVSCRPISLEVPISVSAKLCLEPKKSSLIFLEDEEKLDFLTTSLQMVLNDSSLYTHKARKEILDNFVGFDGAMKKHIFIGSYLG